ncbi:Pentatricopeptide repeat-containing protein, chloroplastic [Symbiodinium microadriaticum]|uniref:Pentatricopeptide repeat-containing protein, chloroplastic n=1 Tax=Symbiodinium microadriaticum TaxID=2951 RepID=A0A1Q9CUL2_SYMMI|nr:Pentatricopeptide repeat-containing protein, chloroplastic [Symbiodinium microadriaticum]
MAEERILIDSERWQQALQAVDTGDLRPSPAVWTSLLSSASRQASWQLALQLLNKRPEALLPNQVFFNVAASACGMRGMWACSLSVVRDMQLRRFNADHFSYGAAVASGLAWAKGLSVLQTAATQGVETNIVMAGSLVGGETTPWSFSLEQLARLRHSSLRINVITCNAAASSCEQISGWEAALSLALQVVPDETTWGIFLSTLAHASQWQEALQCLQNIQHRALRANSIHATSALTAAASGSDGWKQSLAFMTQVSTFGLQSNSFMVSAAVSSCDSHVRWEQAVSVVRRDLHDWLRVNSVVYNSLVSACASGAQWLKAQEVFFSSQALGVRDREAQAGANAAVEALGRSLLWPQAIDCLELLKPLGSWKLEANIAAYSSALTGCARAKAWACGLELWHATSAVGLSDGSPTLNAVVTSAGQGLWQLAFSLVSSYQADAPTYGAALRACLGEAADVAFGLFEQMRLKKIDPDEAAWATVIMVAARGDTGQRQVFSRLVDDLRPEAILKMRSVSGIP